MITPLEILAEPLPNGVTYDEEFQFTADPADGLDWTGVVVRADLRKKKSRTAAALLSLASDAAPTPNGSALTVSTAAPNALTFRLRFTDEDTAALAYDAELWMDVEVEYPSGDVDRLLRIQFLTDGEYTHA